MTRQCFGGKKFILYFSSFPNDKLSSTLSFLDLKTRRNFEFFDISFDSPVISVFIIIIIPELSYLLSIRYQSYYVGYRSKKYISTDATTSKLAEHLGSQKRGASRRPVKSTRRNPWRVQAPPPRGTWRLPRRIFASIRRSDSLSRPTKSPRARRGAR